MEVHKVLRLPRIPHVNKQVNTLITMEGRTGDHRRQPQTTQHPQPLTEHGGSQSAAPATTSGDISVCVVTKCRACHEFCTGGSQSAAPATNSARQETSEYSDNRKQPQTTQHPQPLTEHGGSQSAAPATNSGVCCLCVCCLGVWSLYVLSRCGGRMISMCVLSVCVCVCDLCVCVMCVVSVCVISVCACDLCVCCLCVCCCLGVEGGGGKRAAGGG